MLTLKLSPVCASSQASSPVSAFPKPPGAVQFVSPVARKSGVAKVDDLVAAGVLRPLDAQIVRFLFERCPGRYSGHWFPSQAAMAQACGVKSVETVFEGLKRLRAAGVLDWSEWFCEVRPGVRRQMPNVYRFCSDFLSMCREAFVAVAVAFPVPPRVRRPRRSAFFAPALGVCAAVLVPPSGPPRPVAVGASLLSSPLFRECV